MAASNHTQDNQYDKPELREKIKEELKQSDKGASQGSGRPARVSCW
jgi:hypothetical protein